MEPVAFKNAYYIKLGKKGEWEKSSIEGNLVRIGWASQSIEDINRGNWEAVEKQLEAEIQDPGARTRDLNALKLIAESTSEDVWVTFYASHLWWCRLGEKWFYEDEVSKYREVQGQWRNHDIYGNPLIANQISGRLARVQGFRGTICSVRAADDLRRLLNNQPSQAFQDVVTAKKALIGGVEKGLKLLHWRDFETLVDLVFRSAGWRRISYVGKAMRYVDIELEEPITRELYQVQVKSTATPAEFVQYAQAFPQDSFRKLYFVVHTPQGNWSSRKSTAYECVELILPERLARMIVESGLTDWVLQKIK
ncbi:MAG: hypothetical protein ACYTEQ_04135 [Planctomycetota bacterium]|jgi:hypothetical protein